MDALDVANRYFAAWNRRDSSAVAAIFPEDGTYSDPTIPGAIRGGAIAEYAAGLFAAFPDLSFEILHAAPTTDTRVAAQWVMHGRNTGALSGAPPSGRTVTLPGADFIGSKREGTGCARCRATSTGGPWSSNSAFTSR